MVLSNDIRMFLCLSVLVVPRIRWNLIVPWTYHGRADRVYALLTGVLGLCHPSRLNALIAKISERRGTLVLVESATRSISPTVPKGRGNRWFPKGTSSLVLG